jgi:hypothetical protein
VHCVDPFDGSGDSSSVPHYDAIIMAFGARSPREQFEKNIRSAGLSDWVEVHQGTAEEIATAWTTPIDLLILDGDQSPWQKPGGVNALDNSSPREYEAEHDGHHLVATEEIHPPRYIERQLVGSMTSARKGRPTWSLTESRLDAPRPLARLRAKGLRSPRGNQRSNITLHLPVETALPLCHNPPTVSTLSAAVVSFCVYTGLLTTNCMFTGERIGLIARGLCSSVNLLSSAELYCRRGV